MKREHILVFKKPDILVASLLGLSSFIIYLLTLSPDIVGGDPGEAQFVPYILGLMHAPGYPLYTLMGWVWGHAVPLGNVALRMNLLSAVWAASTVALIYLMTRRLGSNRAGAMLASFSLALNPLFWEWATMAGIRSLTAFSFALVLYLALSLRETSAEGKGSIKAFWLFCLVLGLSLAHHRTIVLLFPALAFLLWDKLIQLVRSPRILLIALIMLIIPLLLYLYLPIRSLMAPPFDRDKPNTLDRFLDFVIFWGAVASSRFITVSIFLKRLYVFASYTIQQFHWLGFALGFAGLIYLAKIKSREMVFLLLSYLALVGFTLVCIPMLGEKLLFFLLLPAHLIFALWIGLGVDFLMKLALGLRTSGNWPKAISTGLFIGSTMGLGMLGLNNYHVLEETRRAPLDFYRQSLRGWNARRFAELTFNLVAPHSLIIADWEQATPLWYLQLIEGKRPDVQVISLDEEWKFDAVVEKARQEGRPVYAARAFPALYGRRFLDNVGPVIHLREEPSTHIPSEAIPLDLNFDGKLGLKGYKLWKISLKRGDVLPITLYWQALTPMEQAYSFSVRLVGPNGKEVIQQDRPAAVLGCYPTFLWSPGEVIGDYYELPLKPNWPPGQYKLKVIVYHSPAPGVWYNLKVGESETAEIASFEVK
ncbi:MAG: DUF2723 domain-containing protein [Anaerolineae bacterium]|nr:DUF2723 domain-containing protein [Anaerolineae bacterium]MDW8101774.1 DUF2723 domain-containing protein [Anaerolineae bacterium]